MAGAEATDDPIAPGNTIVHRQPGSVRPSDLAPQYRQTSTYGRTPRSSAQLSSLHLSVRARAGR